jgi:antitoxin YefM
MCAPEEERFLHQGQGLGYHLEQPGPHAIQRGGHEKATILVQYIEQVTAMRIISYSEARNGLKSVLDGVEADADITIITRRDGGDAVVMSMAHYQSMAETLYLLSSPANAAHLAASIAEHKAGKAKRRELLSA